jgi:Protein of unknown function VcgC/VcgE (DUF2780)
MKPLTRWSAVAVAFALVQLVHAERAHAAPPKQIVTQLQDRIGLTEVQARGALGALLVFVRERLPEPEFKDLAEVIPNADYIMQDVKQRGIVTRPLDDLGDYEAALANLGIGQPLAHQVVPAVLDALAAAGRDRERDILQHAID